MIFNNKKIKFLLNNRNYLKCEIQFYNRIKLVLQKMITKYRNKYFIKIKKKITFS